MATSVSMMLRDLRLLAAGEGPADAELLTRFVRRRDESAFTALVARHGPMVWRACRRVSHDGHAAADAFQATFLLLARKAAGLARPEAVAGWLHGVAVKVALNARARRRPASLPEGNPAVEVDPLAQISARELVTMLDEEIQRLPEACRLPVVLCCLEGQTQEEVARRLGWSVGSVKGRQERGRRRLHARLAKRGLSLPAVLVAAEVARGALPARLLCATAGVIGGTNATVEALADSVGQGLLTSKASLAGVLVVAAFLSVGGVMAYRTLAVAPVEKQNPNVPSPADQAAARVDAQGDSLPLGAIARLGTARLRHGRRIIGLALTPDGKTVFTRSDGSHDVDIHLWDTVTGKHLRRVGSPSRLCHFNCLVLSADGRTLAAGESGPMVVRNAGEVPKTVVRLWDLTTGQQLPPCWANDDGVHGVAISPDGKTVASCGDDKTIRLWDVPTSRELRRCVGHEKLVYAVAFSPEGQKLVSGGFDKMVLWDVTTGKQQRVLDGPPKGAWGAMQVRFSPDGKSIIAFSWNNPRLPLFDVASWKVTREFNGDLNGIWDGGAFLPDGKSMLSASRDGTVRVWDVTTGKEVRQVRAGADDLLRPSLSADGKLVAAGGNGGAIHIWSTATWKRVHAFPGHTGEIHSLRFTPDGLSLASGCSDGALHLWDLRTRTSRKVVENPGVSLRGIFSPDGALVAAAGANGRGFGLHDVATGTLVRRFAGHDGYTNALAFSPDGKTIATGGADKLIRLWDAATGKPLRSFAGHPAAVGTVQFSPDGKLLASLGNWMDKVASLLQQGVCVSLVDLVSVQQANLYGELLTRLGHAAPTLSSPPPHLYALTLRTGTPPRSRPRVEAWFYPMTVGQTLPTLPVWLATDICVPLPLETSYQETCRILGIGGADSLLQ